MEREILYVNLSRWFPRDENSGSCGRRSKAEDLLACPHWARENKGRTLKRTASTHTHTPWVQMNSIQGLCQRVISKASTRLLLHLHRYNWHPRNLYDFIIFQLLFSLNLPLSSWFPMGVKPYEVTLLRKMTIQQKNMVMQLRKSISTLLVTHLLANSEERIHHLVPSMHHLINVQPNW